MYQAAWWRVMPGMNTSTRKPKSLFVRSFAVLATALLLLSLSASTGAPASAAPGPPTVVTVFDDFSSGPVDLVMDHGQVTSQQTGTMVGGIRRTTLRVSNNRYNLNADVRATGAGELLLSSDILVYALVQLGYGAHAETGGRLNLDLSSANAIRVNLGPSSRTVNINVLLWSPDGYGHGFINALPQSAAGDVIMAFDDPKHFKAVGDFDFTQVNSVLLQIQAGEIGSTDYVLNDFSAITL